MHVTFIHSYYENLGIEYISAYLKTYGHKTSLAFEPGLFGSFFAHSKAIHKLFNFKSEIINKVIKLKPDIVAFSVISDNYAWSCELAKEIKKKLDVFIVFGGIHPTSVPERVIKQDFIDFVVVGEGEEAFLELVNAIDKGKQRDNVPNLAFKKNGKVVLNPLRPLIKDLDSLPLPDKDIFYKEYNGLINNAYMIVASRGCKYSCSYCVNSVLNKIYPRHNYFRRRSVDNVIDELSWARQRYDIKKVTFYDEIFTSDRIWLKEFLVKYKNIVGLPFFCCIYPSNLDNETVGLLVDAGCSAVNIGIQTYSEDFRRRILNRNGNNEEIISALKLLRKTKIFVYSNIMLGLPGQTGEELIKTLEFSSLNKADIASTYWLRYYPRTAIIDTARRMGELSDKQIDYIEGSAEYTPYSIKGNTFNIQMSKIGNLILLSSIFPAYLTKLIIKRKYYKYMPSKSLLFPAIFIIGIYKKIFQKKKHPFHYFGILDYMRYYFYYIRKKILNENSAY